MYLPFLQKADLLLSEIDAARAKAREAVEMGERTLREANETLQTLLGKVHLLLMKHLNHVPLYVMIWWFVKIVCVNFMYV